MVSLKRVLFLVNYLLIFLADSGLAQSQWSTSPQTNNVVVTLSGSQQLAPAVAKDGSGGAVLVWVDNRSGDLDIYSMRIDAGGQLIGVRDGNPVAIAVNNQEAPSLVNGPEGRIFIAWQDNRGLSSFKQILTQRLSPNGEPIWPEAVLAHAGNNSPPLILANQFQRAITASYSTALFDDVISIQFLDDSGTAIFDPQKIVSAGAAGRQPNQSPAVVNGLDGGVIAAWVDARQDTVIFIKGLLPSGAPWTAGEIIVSESVSEQAYPVAAADGKQGAIVVWFEPGPEGTDVIRARRIDPNGDSVWQPAASEVSSTGGQKQKIVAVEDGSGGAYIVWENLVAEKPRLFAQRVFSDGQTWAADIEVAGTTGRQTGAKIINNGNGNAIIVWEDSRNGNLDIYSQLVDSSGNKIWGPDGVAVSTASRDQTNPVLVEDGSGGAIFTWQDFRNGSDSDIYVQRVSKPGVLGEFRTITVNSPQPGDDWEVNSSQQIQWSASPEIGSVKIELSRDGGLSYETLFGAVPNLGSETGEITYVPVSGPASTACRLRISAVGASFIRDASNLFSISSPQGPELQLQQVSEGILGDSIFVTTNASDISGVQDVVLNFRLGGESSFTSTNMQLGQPDRFRGAIPANFVTERGVEYFISSQDAIGQSSNTDTFFVTVSFAAGVQTHSVATGSIQSAYRMISTPNLLDEALADAIFANSGFGAYDTTSWRLFEFRDNRYVERDSLNFNSFTFSTGKAYWLISASPRTIDFGAGRSRSVESPPLLSLAPGWNQVGQPFAFSVSWASILEASGNPAAQGPFLFDGAFELATTIDPYEGYFVFNPEPQNISLIIPAVEFDPNQLTLIKDTPKKAEWQLTITAQCETARDEFNVLGIHESAEQGWDLLDLPEPPPIGEYVSVSFPREDWLYPNRYTTDYRNHLGAGQIWSFKVRTNIANAQVTLTFDQVGRLPWSVDFVLLDEKLNVTQNLRSGNSYTISTGPKGVTKDLKLVIGSQEYVSGEIEGNGLIPNRFSLSQNFPNPFNPSTTIRYGLPRASNVSLRIYNILGRKVVTLIDDEPRRPGFHIMAWNGKDTAGRSVASGLYVYRIVAGDFSQTRKMLLVK